MAIGSLLLRPQTLELAAGPSRDQALGDLWELFRLIRELGSADEEWARILLEELNTTITDISQQAEPRLDRVLKRVEKLFSAPLEQLVDLVGTPDSIGDVAATLAQGSLILEAAATALEQVTSDGILKLLKELLELVEEDLGLGPNQWKAHFQGLINRIIGRLKADFINGANSGTAYQKYQLGQSLDKLKSLANVFEELPELDKVSVLNQITPLIQSMNLDTLLKPLIEQLRKLSTILQPVSTLMGGASLNAEAELRTRAVDVISDMRARNVTGTEETCWYASWLYNRPIKDVDPHQRLEDDKIDFRLVGAEKMEAIAFHTKWIAKWLEILPHTLSMFTDPRHGFSTAGQPTRDFVSNLLNILWNLTDFSLMTIGDINVHRGFQWLVKPIVSWLGAYALPNFRYSDPFGILMNLEKMAETQLYARWAFLLREFGLSLLTLLNHKPESFASFQTYLRTERESLDKAEEAEEAKEISTDEEAEKARKAKEKIRQARQHLSELERIHNHNQVDGMAFMTSEVFLIIYVAIIRAAGKENYGVGEGNADVNLGNIDGDDSRFAGLLIGGWLVALAFNFGGIAIGAGTARKWPDADVWFHTPWKTKIFFPYVGFDLEWGSAGEVFHSIAQFVYVPLLAIVKSVAPILDDMVGRYLIYYFMFNEGKTDGGKYAHPALVDILGSEFNGYPDRASSPYILPFDVGRVYQCGQGNLGMWSHTPFSFWLQTYSFDFNNDFEEPVTAMRSGIAWLVVDGNPNSNTTDQNFIVVLHHLPEDPVHDTYIGTTPARTMAAYVHGATNSVTAAINNALGSGSGSNRRVQNQSVNTLIGTNPNFNINVIRAFAAVGVDLVAMQIAGRGTQPIPTVMDMSANAPLRPVYVVQSQHIMGAGDTGVSFYNHLHINLLPNAVGTTIVPSNTPLSPTNVSTLSNGARNPLFNSYFSIPFSFRDVGDDGVPKSFVHYEASVMPADILITFLNNNTATANSGDLIAATFLINNASGSILNDVMVQVNVPAGLNYIGGSMAVNPFPIRPFTLNNMQDAKNPVLLWDLNDLTFGASMDLQFNATRVAGSDTIATPFVSTNGLQNLTITTQSDDTPRIRVSLQVINSSASPVAGVEVAVPVPDGFTYDANTIEGGDRQDDSDTSNLKWGIDPIDGGETVELAFTVSKSASGGLTINPAVTPAGLVVLPSPSNEFQTKKIIVTNNDSVPVNDIRIEDLIPAGQNYTAGTISKNDNPDDSNARRLRWLINTLGAGDTRELSFGFEPGTRGDQPHLAVQHFNGTPELQLSSSFSDPNAPSGATIAVTLTLTNAAASAAGDVFVRLNLPPGLRFSGNMTGGEIMDVAPVSTLVWRIDNITAGANRVLTFDAVRTANPNLDLVASYSVNPSPIIPAVTTQNATNPAPPPPAPPPPAAQGDTVPITITAVNNGPTDAINVLIQNIVPPGLNYITGTIAGDDGTNPLPAQNLNDTADPFLTWRIDALPNGTTATLTFDATRTADSDVDHITEVIGRESVKS